MPNFASGFSNMNRRANFNGPKDKDNNHNTRGNDGGYRGDGGYGGRGDGGGGPNNRGYRGGNDGYRAGGRHPPPDPDVLPLPILKKEELEQFQDAPASSHGWASSASEIDFK